MTPDPDRLRELYNEVLDCAPEERAAFLARACAGDDALRSEIESLLTADDRSCDFLDATTGGILSQVTPDPNDMIGRRIGPFLLVEFIGAGGMGMVYRAEQETPRRTVALKVLAQNVASWHKTRQRFKREAEIAARLNHPNVCTVYEVGEAEGIPYIAMEFIDGQPLSESLDEARSGSDAPRSVAGFLPPERPPERPPEGPSRDADPVADAQRSPATESGQSVAAVKRVVDVVATIARALHAAHEAGLVHRDIKPGNLMITRTGIPKMLDFGLAFDQAEASAMLTQSGEMLGTPAYMSPEQIRAGRARVDRRTDIYSLGVVMFECLSLRRPFEAPTREGIFNAILNREAPDLGRINTSVPRDVIAIVETALEKDANRRYATAAAMADDLEAFAQGRPVSVRRLTPIGRSARWARRHPPLAALVAILLVGAPVVTGLVVDRLANADKIREAQEARTARKVDRCLADGFHRLGAYAFDEAIAHFEEALDTAATPPPQAIGGLAAARVLNQPVAEGLAIVDRLAAEYPNVKGLGHIRALALRRLGKADLATAQLERLGEPADEIDCFLAALSLTTGSEPDAEQQRRALRWVTNAILRADGPRAYYYFLRASVARGCGEDRLATDTADILIERWPDDDVSWFYAGLAHSGIDRAKAIAYYERSLAMRRLPNVLFNLANELRLAGRLDEAIPRYEEAIALKPRYADAMVNLAYCYWKTDQERRSLETVLEALRIDASISGAHALVGQLLKDVAPKRAIAFYEQAVELAPHSHRLKHTLGELRRTSGDLDGAQQAYEAASRLAPNNPRYHFLVGNCFFMKRQFEEAIARYRQTTRLAPKHTNAHLNLGESLLALKQYEEAIEAYEAYLATSNRPKARSYFGLGLAHQRTSRYEEAIDAYTSAIQAKPEFARALCNRGLCLLDVGRPLEALSDLRKGHRIGSARSKWSSPSADWVITAERTALRQIQQRLRRGLAPAAMATPTGAKDRSSARTGLRGLIDGWRVDLAQPANEARIRRMAGRLSKDRLFASLQNPASAAKLPAPEREQWKTLMADLVALSKRKP